MRVVFLFLILVVSLNAGIAQVGATKLLEELIVIEQLFERNQFDAGEKKLEWIQEKYKEEIQQNSIESQLYHRTLASYYNKTSDTEKAFEAAMVALERTTVTPDSIEQIIKTYESVVEVFKNIGNVKEGIAAARKLEKFYIRTGNKTLLQQAYNYRVIGLFYVDKGEPNRGLEYFEKALAIYKEHPETKFVEIASVYAAQVFAYGNSRETAKQKNAIDKTLSYCKRDTSRRSQLLQVSMLSALGGYYIYSRQNEKGLATYQQYLEKIKAIRGMYHPSTANGYMNTAIAYAQTGDLETSEQYFEKSLEITTQIYGKHNASLALNYANFTYLLNLMNKPQKALWAAHKAFTANVIGYSDTNYLANLTPAIEQYEILDPVNLIGNLNNRGEIFYKLYLKTKKVDYLESAYQNLLTQVAIFDKTKNGLSDKDKLKVLGEAFMPYANGIAYAYQLYQIKKDEVYLDMSFELAERSKDAVLLSSLNATTALNVGNVPDSIIQEENKLKKKISTLEKKIYNTQKEDKIYSKLQERLFDTKRMLENLIANLERQYPQYLAYKNTANTASIKDIQAYLKGRNTAMIAYYVGKEKLTYWRITEASKAVYSIKIDSTHEQGAEEYRKLLTDVNYFRNNTKTAMASYKYLGYTHYQNLLERALDGIEVENLVIVPDNFLGHLPFETFLTEELSQEENSLNTLPYLVNDYNIQYSYSGNILLQNHSMYQRLTPNTNVLGIATNYDPELVEEGSVNSELRKKLIPLPEARKEVQRIEEILDGTYLFGAAANEANFKEQVSNHGVLHLAMHGILNSDNPATSSLAFSVDTSTAEDGFLYAYEIVNQPIEAQLVVLSACETGYGKFEKGEGVMSLARSFMHARVPSLVVSLWQVNDYSTAKIMEFFYQELKKGKTKSEALRLAKLTYMNKAEGIAAHPAFWAAFIQLGDPSPVFTDTAINSIWWIGLLIVGILGGTFWWLRRKRLQA